ncbi:hypothetical protein ABZZ17_35800 [Streptomyces sp. NPDC006512]|uniref:hypothetical protein n=1 Tax=Streptomyces sp. NPDC006512 TaxID=3154307 RepID=UPI0033A6E6B3
MKLRRMAAVAAAAVVGPTVLTVTPAMAQDKPALSAPDALPQAGAQAAGAAAGATAEGQAAASGPAAKSVASPGYRNNGPKLSMTGVPKTFEAGGGWTQLTVTADNRGGLPVDDFVAAVGVAQEAGNVKAKHIKAEVRQADGSWKSVPFRLDRGETVYEVELPERDVPTEQVYSAEVRIAFTADTPAGAFELYVGGEGHRPSPPPHRLMRQPL